MSCECCNAIGSHVDCDDQGRQRVGVGEVKANNASGSTAAKSKAKTLDLRGVNAC